MVSIDSCLAASMNAQVLTTSTSASAASRVSSCPACWASPSITSESTRFLGQPRETKSNLHRTLRPDAQCLMPRPRPMPKAVTDTAGTACAGTGSSRARARGRRSRRRSARCPCRSRRAARAVAAQVEVPLERLLRQLVLLDALQQQVEVVHALAAADDLAVALGRQHVDAQRELGSLGSGFM